jgi:hypothetical protein
MYHFQWGNGEWDVYDPSEHWICSFENYHDAGAYCDYLNKERFDD